MSILEKSVLVHLVVAISRLTSESLRKKWSFYRISPILTLLWVLRLVFCLLTELMKFTTVLTLQVISGPQRYLGTVREEETLNILLEFVPGGSISSLLGKFGSFPEPVSLRFFANWACSYYVTWANHAC